MIWWVREAVARDGGRGGLGDWLGDWWVEMVAMGADLSGVACRICLELGMPEIGMAIPLLGTGVAQSAPLSVRLHETTRKGRDSCMTRMISKANQLFIAGTGGTEGES